MRLLFVEDEKQLSDLVLAELPREWVKHAAYTLADARRILATNIIDVVMLDLRLPDGDGLDLLAEIREQPNAPEVFILTGHGSIPEAVKAMRYGVFDFLSKPVSIDRLATVIQAAGMRRGVTAPKPDAARLADELLSPELRILGRSLRELAETDVPVLVLGEPGVGKAHFAHYIHRASNRQGPCLTFEADAVPTEMAIRELFGHGKTPGRFAVAQGGSLILNNVALLPKAVQQAFIENLDAIISCGTRVLATSDPSLRIRLEDGRFAEELFYFLAGFTVTLPPLRARPADIGYFAGLWCRRPVSDAAEEELRAYDWPSNLSELRFVLQSAEDLAGDAAAIEARHVEAAISVSKRQQAPTLAGPLSLEDVERAHIRRVLQMAGGNQTKAARLLGIDPKTLYRKLKQSRVS